MATAQELLKRQYAEMRGRILSLAADIDRLHRAPGGDELLAGDPLLGALLSGTQEILSDEPGRAERVQMILSDRSPPPQR